MKKEVLAEGVELYLGDCREILPTIWGVDAVISDPPYGVGLTKKTSRYNKNDNAEAYSDSEEIVLPAILYAVEWATRNARRAAITPGTRLMPLYPRPKSIGTIFSPGAGGRDSWGFGCNNPILYYGKCPYLATGKGSRPNSFASYAANPYGDNERSIKHPCPKPLFWMEWLINRASLAGEVVCDPFMGSGTTGVAAVKLGRKFIGIELEPKYFEIACKRIQVALDSPDMFIELPAKAKQEAFEL